MFFKIAVLAAAGLIMWQAFRLWVIARELRVLRLAGQQSLAALKRKKWAAAGLCASTIGAVAFIEYHIQTDPQAYATNATLLSVHLIIVTGFTILIVAMICFNGQKFPRMHRIFGYSAFTLLGLAFLTGGAMLYQLPS